MRVSARLAHPTASPAAPVAQAASLTPTPLAFRLVLALFTIVTAARVSDVVPALNSLPIGKLLGALMIVLAAVLLPRADVRTAVASTPVRAFVVITVLAVLSVPGSVWPGQSFGFITGPLLPGLVFFFIGCAGFVNRPAARLTILFVVLTVTVGALRIIILPANFYNGRAFFGSLDPNDTAALFVATIPFALLLASERGFARRLLYAVPALLVVAIVRTGSRGGLMALMVVGLCLVCLATPRRRITYLLGVLIAAATVTAVAPGQISERLSSAFDSETDYNYSDRDGRIAVWKRGIGYMVHNPILGVGVGAFSTAEGTISGKKNVGYGIRYTAAHNSFVQIGAELGVVGLGAFLTACVTAGVGCWRVRRRAIAARAVAPELADQEAALAGSALAALLGLLTAAFFLSFAYHPITYLCIAMCTGVALGSPFAGRKAEAVEAATPPDGPVVARANYAAPGWRSSASRRRVRA